MTIEIGIIGCGRAATELHLPALRRVGRARVTALADSDPSKLSAASERFGIGPVYPGHRELLENEAVDAVLIATPATGRVPIVRDCLASGRHALVEKPLAASPQEAEELVELARGTEVRTAVGHNLRCHRLVREARQLLADGALGELEAAFSLWSTDIALRSRIPAWRERRETLGGAVHEVAIHHFDLWRHLLDRQLERVWAVSKPGERDDDSTAISCRYAGGLPVTLLVSQTTAVQHVLEIWGRKGRMRLDLYRFDGLEVVPTGVNAGDPGVRGTSLLRTLRDLPSGVAVARRGGDFLDTYRVEWERFLAAIAGEGPIACAFEDGLAAVAAAHAAARSAATGEIVSL